MRMRRAPFRRGRWRRSWRRTSRFGCWLRGTSRSTGRCASSASAILGIFGRCSPRWCCSRGPWGWPGLAGYRWTGRRFGHGKEPYASYGFWRSLLTAVRTRWASSAWRLPQRQDAEQVELGGGERDHAAGQADAAGAVVDGEVAEDERLGLGPVPEHGPDAGHEFGRGERLDGVVGRTALERPGDRLVAAGGGDEDDGEVGELGNLVHELDAVGSGKRQALRAPEGMPSGSEPIPRPVRFHTPERPQVGAPGHGRPRSVPQHPGRRTRPLDEAAFDQYAVRHDRISRGSPFVRRSKPTMPPPGGRVPPRPPCLGPSAQPRKCGPRPGGPSPRPLRRQHRGAFAGLA